MIKEDKDLKARRDVLLRARDKMNDSGRHWVKGFYKTFTKGKVEGEACYCAVGAIKASTRNKLLRESAYEDLIMFGGINSQLFSSVFHDNERKIINWNDDWNRTWEEIDSAFRKAAKDLV